VFKVSDRIQDALWKEVDVTVFKVGTNLSNAHKGLRHLVDHHAALVFGGADRGCSVTHFIVKRTVPLAWT
jgi:hypothetical protein